MQSCCTAAFSRLFIFISSSDCHDVPAYQLKCPDWKVKHDCSDKRIPGWSDSINSLCPKTCGLCGNIIIFSSLDSPIYFFFFFGFSQDDINLLLSSFKQILGFTWLSMTLGNSSKKKVWKIPH